MNRSSHGKEYREKIEVELKDICKEVDCKCRAHSFMWVLGMVPLHTGL